MKGVHSCEAELPCLKELVGHVALAEDIVLEDRDLCDLEMLMSGAMDPLQGYMVLDDYVGCLEKMRLRSGQVWTIPIVLPVKAADYNVRPHSKPQTLKLRDLTNALIAEVEVGSIFKPSIDHQISHLFGEDAEAHPYSAFLRQQHSTCVYVGGKVRAKFPLQHFDFRQLRLNPAEARQRIKERGWDVVVGFQTRNPMHRSHFEVTVHALKEATRKTEKQAHLMLTPAVGPTQPDDIDYPIRVRCYQKILDHYPEEPLLVLLPLAMRMAGPREAVWHAQIRKSYGCTHFIVGRDHAGPSCKRADGSSFFGPYDAHQLLAKFAPEIGIEPLFARNMLYCGEEVGFLPEDEVPKSAQTSSISGTQFRKMLTEKEEIPEWFCFRDVTQELQKEFKPLHERGLCVYFTGLPCSGKSTLACALRALILESAHETRKITLLDADVIRTHLSKGIGFSKADRQVNVRRIGYVAHEIVKHGGICLVANIAPYKEDRSFNRRLVESVNGHYIEVYVSTPLDVCESRDIKELYKKARAGVITAFTGISDPYEAPENPDFLVDSSTDVLGKAYGVLDYLKNRRLCL